MPTGRLPLLPVDQAASAAAEVDIIELKAHSCLYRSLLHHPQLAARINDLIDTLMTDAGLEARLRELIVLRIGWSNGTVYQWTHHWRIAQTVGLEERELLAVRDWEANQDWSPAERAALRATDETVRNGVISPSTWDECRREFPTDAERLALVATIGSWKMMSEVLASLEVPLEDGVAPWPPDGMAPGRQHGATSTNEQRQEHR
ncbi:MAG: carboxymuconolactone decarboxylase family protein [Actinomycetota bacterium]